MIQVWNRKGGKTCAKTPGRAGFCCRQLVVHSAGTFWGMFENVHKADPLGQLGEHYAPIPLCQRMDPRLYCPYASGCELMSECPAVLQSREKAKGIWLGLRQSSGRFWPLKAVLIWAKPAPAHPLQRWPKWRARPRGFQGGTPQGSSRMHLWLESEHVVD